MPAVLRTAVAALVAAIALAAPASAQTSPVHTTAGRFVDGPFGTRLVRPADSPRCDARYLQVGVRFTRFTDSAHVRSVRVMLLNPDGTRGRGDSESFAAGRGRLQLGRLHPRSCGRSYLVRYRVNAGTRDRVRTFAVRIAE